MTYRPYNQLTASGLSDIRPNNTGVTITKGTPIRINSSGELDFVNVTSEAQALAASGIAAEDILNLTSGSIVTSGKVQNIITTASFGDLLFIDKTGALTNIKPSIGINSFVAGDFVVSAGVVAKNVSNPLLKDLIVIVDIIGQL